jgi:UDP-2,3-diacylglucosamine pyrophosphatase LpxH
MHYKTLFVSDIHLGTKQCQIQYLLKFIHDNTFDNVYLVGDIIDVYSLSRRWYWHKDHNTFIQKILKMARHGTRVCYIPGNHDIIVREWIQDINPFFFGDIVIVEEADYISKNGNKYKILHGDCFDGAIRSMGWLYWLGDYAYDACLSFNTFYNKIRKLFGMQYWSISAYLKSKVKQAIQVLTTFDEVVTRKCLVEGYAGLIYGHSHTPSIKTIKTKILANIGDMVENHTCIVETEDGKFQLIRLTNNTVISEIIA